jgi:hypothetical protein
MKIGFTGHQNLAHPNLWLGVRQQFENMLKGHAGSDCRVITSLAKGGDQVFAEVALSLGIAIESILPSQSYETAFSDEASRENYHRLLQLTDKVITLEFARPLEEAFLAAGHYIVDHCDLMIALWNEQPCAGKGGTADIVKYVQSRGRSLVLIPVR